MYVHVKDRPETRHLSVFYKDTHKTIDYCIWANDATGVYCVYDTDENGKLIKEFLNGSMELKRVIKKGNIGFIDLCKKTNLILHPVFTFKRLGICVS